MGNNADDINKSFSNPNSPELNNLGRFIHAQNEVDYGYEQAKSEITKGKKVSHWIWYIFPQIKSLGFSIKAKKYGIADFSEACNYLRNKTLFQRYMELVLLVKKHLESRVPLIKLMGVPDDTKLISSITLFHGIALFLQQQNPKANYKDLADCCAKILNLVSQQNYSPCKATSDFLKISKKHANTIKLESINQAELVKAFITEMPKTLEDKSSATSEKNVDKEKLIDKPETTGKQVQPLSLELPTSGQEILKSKEQKDTKSIKVLQHKNQSLISFNEKLELLTSKIGDFERRAEVKKSQDSDLDKAILAISILKLNLVQEKMHYLCPSSTFASFKINCEKHLKAASITLNKHRSWSELMINLLLLITVIGFAIKASINIANNRSIFFVHKTNSSKLLDEIEGSIQPVMA